MCDVTDLNFVRPCLSRWMIQNEQYFVRSLLEMLDNSKHSVWFLMISFFRPVYSRAVGKLMFSLLYSNFKAFKLKRDCQIYEIE